MLCLNDEFVYDMSRQRKCVIDPWSCTFYAIVKKWDFCRMNSCMRTYFRFEIWCSISIVSYNDKTTNTHKYTPTPTATPISTPPPPPPPPPPTHTHTHTHTVNWSPSQYKDVLSTYKDNTVTRPSYLNNGNPIANFFIGNITMYLQFIPFLHIDMR